MTKEASVVNQCWQAPETNVHDQKSESSRPRRNRVQHVKVARVIQ